MGLITKSQPPKIAVDISSTAVKLLQLSRAGDRYRVEHYAIEPLPANAVVDKNIADPEAVGEGVKAEDLERMEAETYIEPDPAMQDEAAFDIF